MEKKRMGKNGYYLGLDMGTSSVGWAVTDDSYHILRKKGKDLWGIREYDEAKTATDRRTHRISRRRRQRQTVRIGLLNSYFADEIEKVDQNFFIRLQNSKYFPEDKDQRLTSVNGIFDDVDYTDADYYRDYPTIFHLREALLDIDCTGKSFDVRMVYLAVLNMFKHRGHFLLSTGSDALDAVQVGEIYRALINEMNHDYGFEFEEPPVDAVVAIISDKELGRRMKHEKMLELFRIGKKNRRASEFLKCMCGMMANAALMFEVQSDEDIKICFHDYSYADKIPELMDKLGDTHYAVVDRMKEIYDYAVLAGTLKGYEYLSQARVASYKKHHEDLKLLQKLYRTYRNPSDYDYMFRSGEDGTYSAYVNSFNSSDSAADAKKYRRNMKGRTAEDLYATIKKDLQDYTDDAQVAYVLDQMDKEQFLPKQLTGANGVIPNQVHVKELERILANAENYLSFLKTADESGLTVSERIVRLFSFQIPYYVGPLGKNSATGWAVRKSEGTVLPWNIEEKIDMKATSKEFISRLIRSCTYLSDEKVLPKASLAYERFCVLNEINNLRVDGERIDTQLKQQIFHECFADGRRVTRKQLCSYLIAQGVILSEAQVSGLDNNIHQSLSSYGKMYAIFGEKLNEDRYREIAETMIYWGTIFADSKKMFREHLDVYVRQGVITAHDEKRILGYKFKDWGRLSKALLELQGCDKSTGELVSVSQAMWEYSLNFMELINSDEFTFKEELEKRQIRAVKALTEFTYEDLEEYYFSAPVKRMIWQTLQVVREIEQVMGEPPVRIFVEMTRSEEEKGDRGRKASRANQLLEIYKTIENTETHNWKEEIQQADKNGKMRSKKLYLYYMQMGRDMYTGKEIDLSQLFDDNLYDIDHIYPRHYVKDDNIIDNLVLVNKRDNEHIKKDFYPIPAQISSNPKVRELWDVLHYKKLISDEKYHRLTSKNSFTKKQMGDFIARQLVETAQGTKGVSELLRSLLPAETEIIYAKAANVSEFRRNSGFAKSRLVNEFHHAQDAYLNIVVGNVYFTKFTKNPWNFIKKEYAADQRKNHYNLDRMFAWDVVRGEKIAWIAEKNGEEGTMATVRSMMRKQTPLMTRMSFEHHGEISKATLYSAKKATPENYFALKTSDPKMWDVTKYGGYTSAAIAYYFLVQYKEKKKTILSMEGLPVYCRQKVESSRDGLELYCEEQLGYKNVRILCRKIKIQSLLEINGYRMYLSGKTGNQLTMRNAMNLCISEQWIRYIKKIEKYVEFGVLDHVLDRAENIRLYTLLTDKHLNTVYAKRPNPCGEKLNQGIEKFKLLTVEQQCTVLYQVLRLTKIGLVCADLKLIGGSSHTGVMQISKKLKGISCCLIHQSVTGLFESRVDLLTL